MAEVRIMTSPGRGPTLATLIGEVKIADEDEVITDWAEVTVWMLGRGGEIASSQFFEPRCVSPPSP
jgi:hypothetical protein